MRAFGVTRCAGSAQEKVRRRSGNLGVRKVVAFVAVDGEAQLALLSNDTKFLTANQKHTSMKSKKKVSSTASY